MSAVLAQISRKANNLLKARSILHIHDLISNILLAGSRFEKLVFAQCRVIAFFRDTAPLRQYSEYDTAM